MHACSRAGKILFAFGEPHSGHADCELAPTAIRIGNRINAGRCSGCCVRARRASGAGINRQVDGSWVNLIKQWWWVQRFKLWQRRPSCRRSAQSSRRSAQSSRRSSELSSRGSFGGCGASSIGWSSTCRSICSTRGPGADGPAGTGARCEARRARCAAQQAAPPASPRATQPPLRRQPRSPGGSAGGGGGCRSPCTRSWSCGGGRATGSAEWAARLGLAASPAGLYPVPSPAAHLCSPLPWHLQFPFATAGCGQVPGRGQEEGVSRWCGGAAWAERSPKSLSSAGAGTRHARTVL